MTFFKEFDIKCLKLFKKYHCVGYCVGPVFAVTCAPRAGSGQGPGGARGTPGSTVFPSTFLGEGWELSLALAIAFRSDPKRTDEITRVWLPRP